MNTFYLSAYFVQTRYVGAKDVYPFEGNFEIFTPNLVLWHNVFVTNCIQMDELPTYLLKVYGGYSERARISKKHFE